MLHFIFMSGQPSQGLLWNNPDNLTGKWNRPAPAQMGEDMPLVNECK